MLLEDRYINFICDNNLSQGEFLLLYLLYKRRPDLILKYKNTFPTDDGTMIGQRWINGLVARGWLVKTDTWYTVSVEFKTLFCNKIDVAEELLSRYPSTLEIQGKIIPLTAIDTVTVADMYMDKILDNRVEHEEVLKDIDYAIIHNLINLNLRNFILSKYWLSIRKRRIATTDDDHTPTQAQSFG